MVLFLSGYCICDLFFPHNIDKFTWLRYSIYGVDLFLLAGAMLMEQDKRFMTVEKLLLHVFVIGILAGNLIDKALGINHFSIFDIVTISFSVASGIKKYYPQWIRIVYFYAKKRNS